MTADTGRKPSRTGRSKYGKARLLTLEQMDGRTLAAQHVQRTIAAITADLGGADKLSELERLQVENAALTAVVLRDLQTRWLRGESVPLGDLVATENAFNRTAAA